MQSPTLFESFLDFLETVRDRAGLYELHESASVWSPPAFGRASELSVRIASLLLAGLGRSDSTHIVVGNAGFKAPPLDFYAPRVSVFQRSRVWPVLDDDFFGVPPDVAVEVISGNETHSLHRKALRYIELGVRLVWVVYPKGKSVDVYEPAEGGGATVRTYRPGQASSGGSVLPGFEMPVADIFDI